MVFFRVVFPNDFFKYPYNYPYNLYCLRTFKEKGTFFAYERKRIVSTWVSIIRICENNNWKNYSLDMLLLVYHSATDRKVFTNFWKIKFTGFLKKFFFCLFCFKWIGYSYFVPKRTIRPMKVLNQHFLTFFLRKIYRNPLNLTKSTSRF